jgi:FixJ family two-component response regulator
VSLLQQSSGLKGRYRRRFLYGVNRNTRILEEVDRAFGASVGIDEATRQVAVSMHPLAALGTFDNVEERRKAVAQYLAAGMLQREIALRLGVSERTIRGDVAFLRTAQDSKVNSSVETGLMPMPAAEVIKGVRD